jgi:hypothetical protein
MPKVLDKIKVDFDSAREFEDKGLGVVQYGWIPCSMRT